MVVSGITYKDEGHFDKSKLSVLNKKNMAEFLYDVQDGLLSQKLIN